MSPFEMEKERWNVLTWFKQNFDWFTWNCRRTLNVIATVLCKCIQVTARILLPDVFKELPDNETDDSCEADLDDDEDGDDEDEDDEDEDDEDEDDEDEDCLAGGPHEDVKRRNSYPTNNKYTGVNNEQPGDMALRRRHRHIAENSDKKRNVGKHIQPVEIANNDAQEDDQDEVVDGPKPLPQAFPIGPYIVRAQGNRAPFPPEVPREEPNAGEQNQPVENDANKTQQSGVQEVDEGPNKARCPPVPLARQETRVQVNHHQCTHLIKDTLPHHREDLSDVLDDGAILDVMKALISTEEFEHIWSSCHGGSDPPMNLLFHLAGQNCTLSNLKRFAQSDKGCRFSDLIKVIDNHYRDDERCMEIRLDELDFRLLSEIAELIRAKPYPQKRPLWKRLASYAGLDDAAITVLDVPTTGERKSLTMAFLKRISQTNPRETVAWLASGLAANGLNLILGDEDIEIFKECRGCCINIL